MATAGTRMRLAGCEGRGPGGGTHREAGERRSSLLGRGRPAIGVGDDDGAIEARARGPEAKRRGAERRDADCARGHIKRLELRYPGRSTRRVARTGAERRCEDDAEGGSDGRFQRTSQRGACDGRVACVSSVRRAVEYERRGRWAELAPHLGREPAEAFHPEQNALRAFAAGMLVSH